MEYKLIHAEKNIEYYLLDKPISLGIEDGKLFQVSLELKEKFPSIFKTFGKQFKGGVNIIAVFEPDFGEDAYIYPAILTLANNKPIPVDLELSTYWNMAGESNLAIEYLINSNSPSYNYKK